MASQHCIQSSRRVSHDMLVEEEDGDGDDNDGAGIDDSGEEEDDEECERK